MMEKVTDPRVAQAVRAQYNAELAGYIKERDEAEKKIQDVMAVYVQAFCPFKEGDIIELHSNFARGRSGQKGVVTVVRGILSHFNEEIQWSVTGNILKKDGTPGMNTFRITELDWNYFNMRKDVDASKIDPADYKF